MKLALGAHVTTQHPAPLAGGCGQRPAGPQPAHAGGRGGAGASRARLPVAHRAGGGRGAASARAAPPAEAGAWRPCAGCALQSEPRPAARLQQSGGVSPASQPTPAAAGRMQVACVTAGISICCWVLVYLWCACAAAAPVAAMPCMGFNAAAAACLCTLLICARLPVVPRRSMRLLAGSIPFVRELSAFDAWAVCTLAATLSIARSPASAVSPHPQPPPLQAGQAAGLSWARARCRRRRRSCCCSASQSGSHAAQRPAPPSQRTQPAHPSRWPLPRSLAHPDRGAQGAVR